MRIWVLLFFILLFSCDAIQEYKFRYSDDCDGWLRFCKERWDECHAVCNGGRCTSRCRSDYLACCGRQSMVCDPR